MDPLFPVANNFHIGAYQLAINEGADLSDVPENIAVERDCLVYRSYIALGSHQARRARSSWRPGARSVCRRPLP